MKNFWLTLEAGYYDKILINGLKKKRGLQAGWHHITFTNIKNQIKNNTKHLDYACGPGTLVGTYLNCISYGVDMSINQIEYAKKNYKKKGQFFTTDEFRFENYEKYFDYITVIGLIEFIDKEELINLIKELKKMLNEKGEIYFTTPNFTIGMKIMILVQRVFSRVSYSSVFKTEYTKSKLEDLLSKNYVKNYEITKIQNLGFLFSYFSLNLGVKISNLISKFTFNRTGFLLLLRISND